MGDVLTPAVRALRHSTVIAGIDPAIHAGRRKWCGVDTRIKSAHDGGGRHDRTAYNATRGPLT